MEELPQDVALDRAALRSHERDVYGYASLHTLDPSEMACQMEEFGADPSSRHNREREALRREVFAGFIEYAFSDGPDPFAIHRRLSGFVESFCPEVSRHMVGEVDWVEFGTVRKILRKPNYLAKLKAQSSARKEARLSEWALELSNETDRVTVRRTISEIVALLVREGARWKCAVACVFAMAKAYHPHLIAGMSLEDIATLCGDGGGRATPSDRGKRLHNRRVEAAGAKATHVHYQKSASTVKKYSKAQKGNRNRATKKAL